MSLFDYAQNRSLNFQQPLAEQMRPQSSVEFVGQKKAIPQFDQFIKEYKSYYPNLIIWGPPGSGKTSFAYLIKNELNECHFHTSNAIDLGTKKIKEFGEEARNQKTIYQKNTILFIDEIHRLNKSQQDMLLPFTEKRDLILIGATTENPSYEINSALLSRSRVITFSLLNQKELFHILTCAFEQKKIKLDSVLESKAQKALCEIASGDARKLLNFTEQIFEYYNTHSQTLSENDLEKIFSFSPIYYDKKSSQHYDCISAFIKSVRGSDPNAALYYLARMIEGGEDPLFIIRRLIILASEDIGNADPKALSLATSALEAVKAIGMPEARITLAQVTTYLSCAPKSNSSYMGINKAQAYVKKTGALPVPLKLSAGQKIMASLQKEKDDTPYLYSHDYPRSYVQQSYLPDQVEKELKKESFYQPKNIGFEKQMADYLDWLRKKDS